MVYSKPGCLDHAILLEWPLRAETKQFIYKMELLIPVLTITENIFTDLLFSPVSAVSIDVLCVVLSPLFDAIIRIK